MSNIWTGVSDIGDLLTLISVAPILLGMGFLVLKAGLFGANSTMLEQSVNLMVRGLLALVPLSVGGVFLYVFFQFADEMA